MCVYVFLSQIYFKVNILDLFKLQVFPRRLNVQRNVTNSLKCVYMFICESHVA